MQDTIMVAQGTGIDNIWDRLLRDRSSVIYSSAHNGTISLERTNGKLSRALRS